MFMKWAKIQTMPSVVGRVTNANRNGTTTPPSVPNMNSSTSKATGIAIISPLRRSLL